MDVNGAAYRAGFGVASLTVFEPGMGMFGWGEPANVAASVATPLHARALAIEHVATQRRAVIVVAELGMIPEALRLAVAARVCDAAHGLTEHDLLLTATHTHSGPSGFSTYLMFAMAAPGVSRKVFDVLVQGIVAAVLRALARLEPARLHHAATEIPTSEPVAFNRSLAAYNANADTAPVGDGRADEAVDRAVTVLRVDSAAGAPLGALSWFAVHGTSVHSDGRALHGDNKGYAARAVEGWAKEQGHRDFVALFAQGPAGDVTPNYRESKARGFTIGRFDDDDESARWSGEIQARHALVAWHAAGEAPAIDGALEAALRYADYYDLVADRAFSPARARTAPPRVGLGFCVGTAEGWGPLAALRGAMPWITRAYGAAFDGRHGAKAPLWDLVPGHRLAGLVSPTARAIGLLPIPFVAYYQRAIAWPGVKERGWVPRYLPLQQLRIGPLVIAALAPEATTVSGRRIAAAVRDAWKGDGVDRVVVTPYSNAYAGYLATPEEYRVQAYEGAATLYGSASLPATCSEMVRLTRAIRDGSARRSLGRAPPVVPLDALPPMLG